jgi:anaerobic ribonucleoside-triphosphate reductase activating protein
MNRVSYPVTALGPGRRLGLWFQGCPLACAGCLARDTWAAGGGGDVPEDDLLRRWRAALLDGADGMTVSGGEPLAQPAALGSLLRAAAGIRDELGADADLLVYTGYDAAEIADASPLDAADAVITGRYDVTRPTRLIWRGSSNQVLSPRTPLGARRYGPYLDHEPDRPPMQVGADDRNVWFIGVPRRGDMVRLEGELAARGVVFEGGVTWRP